MIHLSRIVEIFYYMEREVEEVVECLLYIRQYRITLEHICLSPRGPPYGLTPVSHPSVLGPGSYLGLPQIQSYLEWVSFYRWDEKFAFSRAFSNPHVFIEWSKLFLNAFNSTDWIHSLYLIHFKRNLVVNFLR